MTRSQFRRQPGIYIIRDKSGYLYVGEADNLHKRLKKQLDHSDRKALARYLWEMGIQELTVELHVFAADSEGRRTANRRAYETELIKSRNRDSTSGIATQAMVVKKGRQG